MLCLPCRSAARSGRESSFFLDRIWVLSVSSELGEGYRDRLTLLPFQGGHSKSRTLNMYSFFPSIWLHKKSTSIFSSLDLLARKGRKGNNRTRPNKLATPLLDYLLIRLCPAHSRTLHPVRRPLCPTPPFLLCLRGAALSSLAHGRRFRP